MASLGKLVGFTKAPAHAGGAEGEGGASGEAEAEEAQQQGEWVDDGSLPLAEGTLPFFLLDAHEEPATPGTVYLFGKVPGSAKDA